MIELFVNQAGVDKSELKYDAGRVCEQNGNFTIGYEMFGAEKTFSVGQSVYDKEGNLMGYLGIGLYDALDYTTNKNTRIPAYYWQICMPTKYCEVGKRVFTYWQNEERKENE